MIIVITKCMVGSTSEHLAYCVIFVGQLRLSIYISYVFCYRKISVLWGRCWTFMEHATLWTKRCFERKRQWGSESNSSGGSRCYLWRLQWNYFESPCHAMPIKIQRKGSGLFCIYGSACSICIQVFYILDFLEARNGWSWQWVNCRSWTISRLAKSHSDSSARTDCQHWCLLAVW